jgi:hypothetical protein
VCEREGERGREGKCVRTFWETVGVTKRIGVCVCERERVCVCERENLCSHARKKARVREGERERKVCA